MIYLSGSNDLFAGRMISDFILFALAFHFIKKIGNIHFFWQAVPMIYDLKMVASISNMGKKIDENRCIYNLI
jgi:hypothetical protein